MRRGRASEPDSWLAVVFGVQPEPSRAQPPEAAAALKAALEGRQVTVLVADPRLASVRRGMKVADVYGLLGFPGRRRPTREGELAASLGTWETRADVIEVLFVDGLVVKVTASSR